MSAASSKSATDNVLVHTALKSTQAVSILAPPIFVGYHLLRRQPFSIKSFFRKVNLVAVAGAAVAVPVAAYVLKDEAEVEMSERQGKLAHSPTQVRTDDYSLIGFTLGALITPTIFLRRASLPSLMLGGGLLGMSGGIYYHLYKSWTEGRDIKPDLGGIVKDLQQLPGDAKEDVKKALDKS